MKICLIIVFALCTLVSCIPIYFPNLGTDQVEKGEYDIHIYGPNTNTRLVGKHVDTQWIPEDGFIFMNTDEIDTLNPIGTITLQVDLDEITPNRTIRYPFILDSLGNQLSVTADHLDVDDATVSKTEKRKGTAAELDANLFDLVLDGDIWHVELGSNFIRGSIIMRMKRVRTNPNDPNFVEEVVLVRGEFTAMSR